MAARAPRAQTDTFETCVVGAGPRGLSVLERLCANERAAPSHGAVTVHLVDPALPGAGAVWRPDQSRHLLMNTVASQITLFTDGSSRIDGPVEPGPTLYEWARDVASLAECAGEDDWVLREARALGPDAYPTRAFYGRYLHDCYRRVLSGAPAHLTVRTHRSRAVALTDALGAAGGPQSLLLADGTRLDGLDAVVLAQGHVPARPTVPEARAAHLARLHGLSYLPPVNPADADLDGIEPGDPVLLRGLGLNFFDYMALFTTGRGGTYVRAEDGGLAYRPSGREPRLYAFSRRGVPYHARGENQKGVSGRYLPRLLTPERIDALRARARNGEPVRFTADLWPLIAAEVESVYYGTLLTALGRGAERAEFTERYLAAGTAGSGSSGSGAAGEREELLDAFGIAPRHRWDWERLAAPHKGRDFADRAEFRRWLLDRLRADARAAREGNVDGPLKAALDVLRDLRNEIRLAVDHAGLDGASHRDELERWYTPLNAFLSIGPPASRIEEMAALVEAGLLEVTGPGTDVRLDPAAGAFTASSTLVPGEPVRARVLIEARLPEPDLRRTEDPLLRHLLDTGQCAPHRVPTEGGPAYETGGLAVTERPYRVVAADGTAHPRRFAYGVPTEGVHWVTAAGTRPGVDSVTLADADAIARSVLGLTPADAAPEASAALAGVPV
ncbi:FAD/NAD(P)-binding protein [Streptomyces mobaraensis NBRC 13819 = DSM 40847]|uniref:FAD/NAD(P)-binding protein n=1 Tax=Streptomyces mobaraensis TaxID=35621 RepID=UPI00034879A1|nr:FAD/NAD(P)-binding protein [Streptomyces mobaraensis]QTT74435.1 FAD/NAD(P)-binding protein [Streptomyces mobaraensis NBRC 13819 = DSM 40847]